jgi:hypothetical protein
MVSKSAGGTFAGAVTFGGGADFGDNVKARFGTGNDLEIFSDGSNSFIAGKTGENQTVVVKPGGAGSVLITNSAGDNIITQQGDAAHLHYDGVTKIATTSTGALITGDATFTDSDATTIIDRVGTNVAGIKTGSGDDFCVGTADFNQAIRIKNSTGHVGIGTVAPRSNLELANSSGGELTFRYTGNVGFAAIKTDANNHLLFSADATSFSEDMRIDSSGDVLVGCTSLPSSSVAGLGIDASNDSELRCSVAGTGNSTQVRFLNPNGEVGAIRTNGTATSYLTSSDYRLKENVTADWDATTRLKQLNPVRFNFIADADTTVDGFLAHDVQSVVPEAISGTHNEVDDDGNPVYQGIDQSKLVPLLTGALKEAIAKIETLETKVAALEAGS